MNETVLVVVAHPDDEVLGCGGTISKHSRSLDKVHVLFIADGETSRGAGQIGRRRENANRACEILGTSPPQFLDLSDQCLDTLPLIDIVQKIEPLVASVRPTIIYTHHGGDLNLDHRIVHQAVMTALRPSPDSIYKAIFAFEVASSTEWATSGIGDAFRPNHFVDITNFVETKIKALTAYDSEMRRFPHARSYEGLRALATLRGTSNGLEAAEAFVTLRTIVR